MYRRNVTLNLSHNFFLFFFNLKQFFFSIWHLICLTFETKFALIQKFLRCMTLVSCILFLTCNSMVWVRNQPEVQYFPIPAWPSVMVFYYHSNLPIITITYSWMSHYWMMYRMYSYLRLALDPPWWINEDKLFTLGHL